MYQNDQASWILNACFVIYIEDLIFLKKENTFFRIFYLKIQVVDIELTFIALIISS